MYFLSSSHLRITLLIILFYICICTKITYSEHSLIHRICEKTSFADECKMMLNAKIRCVSATDIYELAYNVIEISQTIVLEDILRKWGIYTEEARSFDETQKLNKCIRSYGITWSEFDDTQGLVERKRPNIMTLVSAKASTSKSSVEFCENTIGRLFPTLQEKNTLLKKYYEMLEVMGNNAW